MSIKFAFQHWDSNLKCWYPNTIPFDFHDQNNLPNYGVQRSNGDFLSNWPDIEHVNLEQAHGNKYIFPVIIRDSHYFERQEQLGFDYIERRVINDIHNNRCKLVLIFPLEGDSGLGRFERDFDILDSWCEKHQLTCNHVYYIHGNQIGPNLTKNRRFTMIPVNMFLCWSDCNDSVSKFIPVDNKNLFLNYNRRAKYHRLLMTAHLISANIFDRGLVSYHGDNIKNSQAILDNMGKADLVPAGAIIDSLIPLELDMDLALNNPAWKNKNQEHYKQTFLSLVSETHVTSDVIFFSEKIWKPISAGHPFMLVGSPGMLANLKLQGYQTFGAWWDESYDNCNDLDLRVMMITKELKRLSMLSVAELQDLRAQMQPVLEFNQNLFNGQCKELYTHGAETVLFEIIKNIWDSF